MKYCKDLLSYRYTENEIIGYRHAQTSRLRFFLKQLAPGLTPQSCLYFSGFLRFQASKLLNGFWLVWPSNLCLPGIQYLSGFRIDILWSVILNFSQLFFWDRSILVYCWFNSYFMFITKEKLYFSLNCSFYCCLVKDAWALKVA